MSPVLDVAAVEAFLDREFPQIHEGGRVYSVVSISSDGVRLRLAAGDRHLRPGGTVSGPTMMSLADLTAYVAILSRIGPVALAVTTSFNINFLRKPAPGALVAVGRLLKLGKTLAVVEIAIRAETHDDLVAHATTTYSIPPNGSK